MEHWLQRNMPTFTETPDIRQNVHVLPDPNTCCTKPIGDVGALNPIGTCLVNGPFGCPYLIGFGDNHFCIHPNWNDFIKPQTR